MLHVAYIFVGGKIQNMHPIWVLIQFPNAPLLIQLFAKVHGNMCPYTHMRNTDEVLTPDFGPTQLQLSQSFGK